MPKTRAGLRPWTALALLPVVAALGGCPALSGGPGSNKAPVAVGGPDQVVRSQTEVTLTGKDSYDPDGVIQAFQWKQISGTPQVTMAKANNSTSTFLLPQIFSPTTLEFELTVTDDKGATGATRVKVQAVPPPDSDRFLTFIDVPGTFKVVAATPNGTDPANAGGQSFSVDTATRIDYNVYVDGIAQARSKTYHQTVSGQWPAAGSGGLDPEDYRNPRFTFDLPKINFEDLRSGLKDNERIYNSERNTLNVTTTVTLTPDPNNTNAVNTLLYVLDAAGNRVLDGTGTPVAATPVPGASPTASSVSFSTTDQTLRELFTQRDVNGNPIADEESRKTAEAYYKAIDPNNDKDTLAKFKAADGFVDGDPNTVEVTYINGFDLGFARHMFMREDAYGNLYSYVINAPNLQSANANVNTIAAVAMEYSPAPGAPASDPNKYTKFYTFVLNPTTGKEERVLTMDFDGRGEKFHPGTCMGCHGGRPAPLNPDGTYPDNGDTGAGFLSWDVTTLFFSDDDFENDVHRVQPTAEQQDALRRLNEMVLLTNPPAAENTLIHGWYGSTDPTATKLPAGAVFNPNFIPDGWLPGNAGGPPADKAADAKTLYLQVLAPFCRACHSQRTDPGKPDISFDTYNKYVNVYGTKIGELAFDQGVMPLARHTMDNFWTEKTPSAASILAGQLGFPATRTPGTPTAVIDRVTANGTSNGTSSGTVSVDLSGGSTTVRLNGDASLFAKTFRWQLTAKPSGSTAALVGDTTPDPAFLADVTGDYKLQLVVNNGVADSAPATVTVTATVPPPPPPPTVTFTELNQNIFTQDCIACHNTTDGYPLTFLQTNTTANYNAAHFYVSTLNPTSSELLMRPSSPSIHPGGIRPGFGNYSAQTSDCSQSPAPADYTTNCGNYDKVLTWIQEGAQNN